jgi:hypothetical protein
VVFVGRVEDMFHSIKNWLLTTDCEEKFIFSRAFLPTTVAISDYHRINAISQDINFLLL